MSALPPMTPLSVHLVQDAIAKAGEAQRSVSATGKLKWSGEAAAQYLTQQPAALRSVSALASSLRELELAIAMFNLVQAAVGVTQASGVPQDAPPPQWPVLPWVGGAQ